MVIIVSSVLAHITDCLQLIIVGKQILVRLDMEVATRAVFTLLAKKSNSGEVDQVNDLLPHAIHEILHTV